MSRFDCHLRFLGTVVTERTKQKGVLFDTTLGTNMPLLSKIADFDLKMVICKRI